MKIIGIDTKITKWEQSNNLINGTLKEGDKPAFTLQPHHPVHKSLFRVNDNIYITNVETDFILDIDTVSFIQFDIDGVRPTVKELYDAYLRGKEKQDEAILEQLKEHSILIDRPKTRRSFENLEGMLKQVIQLTYLEN